MRIHRLEMEGIGPFRERQSIDVDALASSGLFLIEGPTGSGKSTIIDAIVFALYGAVSAKGSDVARMRSLLSGPSDPSEVVLEFSVSGVRHRIQRRPAYERLKSRGAGTTLEKARQVLEILDGSATSMTDAREIGAYLLERIGLSAEHFRQLVVLPQGEFDALLRSSPRHRFDVLGRLLDDGFLSRVQEDLRQQADDARALRAASDEARSAVVAAFTARAGEVLQPHDADPDPGWAQAIVGTVNDRAAEESARADSLAQALGPVRAEAATREAALASARGAVAARAAVASAKAALAGTDPDVADTGVADTGVADTGVADTVAGAAGAADADAADAPARLRARDADLVARRTVLEPQIAWEESAGHRRAEATRLADTAAAAHDAVLRAQAEDAELPAQRERLMVALLACTADASLLEAREREVAGLEATVQAHSDHRALAAERADCVSAEERAAADLQGARDALQSARDAHHALVRRQLDQRAAHLADFLQPGEPCAVCGATEHPAIARPPEGDALVSDDDVTAAHEAVSSLDTAVTAASSARERVREQREDLDRRLAALAPALADHSPDEAQGLLASARHALVAAKDAAGRIVDLQGEIADVDRRAALASERMTQLLAVATRADGAVTSFAETERAAEERHSRLLGDEESARAAVVAIDTRRGLIEALRLALAEAARHASQAGAQDLDPEAAASALARAIAERDRVEAAHREAADAATRWGDAARALAQHLQAWQSLESERASVDASTEAAIRIGDLVSARSTANIRRLTLQSYAVQRRFRAVLEAGSVHLERMSSGHFSFELDEEVSRGQTGLGIAIRDAWTGQVRDPATLSGGETFYASLALALGLADIVREESGGVDLETLFVDEGFGSLDPAALQVVLDQLDGLRTRGRTVGVISHVSEMKDWVHDRLVVTPGLPGEGSTVTQTG